MYLTERDIEILEWILEQKYMTEDQIKRVFWKGTTEKSREAYIRLSELRKEGILQVLDPEIYRYFHYAVTKKGVKVLKRGGGNAGLKAIDQIDDMTFYHDKVVTEIRILFHEMGYQGWFSERRLSKFGGYKRLPDGMLYYEGKSLAIEWEASQKARRRYVRLFLDYYTHRDIDYVLFIVKKPRLIPKLMDACGTLEKVYFTTLNDLQRDKKRAKIIKKDEAITIEELFENVMALQEAS